ncbi:TIGR01244 family sulfur transferase [Pseudooceanicola sp. 200-1SW]|uniref:TIGR01244 family sulfur transferase n=1 Tax=Pseudooceanicola sp. 200-1SW TaxID=3425949 RepID=UPI003D7FC8C0
MNIRQISPRYAVSPQIEPEDLVALREAGFARVICNRPDSEIPAPLQSEAMAQAAAEAGIDFVVLPLTHDTMTPENIAKQMAFCEVDGPVLAYCASGTRCSVAWSLGQAASGALSTDEILAATARAGYDLSSLRPRLDQMR